MGQSRGGGYDKVDILSPQQQSYQNWILGQMPGYMDQAAQGFSQFLPGGKGGEAISQNAQRQFQQNTIPSIMNAFGTGSKTNSSLNQALAAGASDLNSNIASQLAQMQLQAASGLTGLAQGSQSAAFQSPFGFQQRQLPWWQQAIIGGLGGATRGFFGG